MSGSNLPPGVSEHMIPGNRPEDLREEAFWDQFGIRLTGANINGFALDKPARSANYVELDDLWDNPTFVEIIQIARDMGYECGFDEGRAEEQMAQAMEHDQDA